MCVIPRASVKYKRYYMHTTEQQVILLVMFEVITFFHSKYCNMIAMSQK